MKWEGKEEEKGPKHTVTAYALFQITNLGLGWVLTACAKKVA